MEWDDLLWRSLRRVESYTYCHVHTNSDCYFYSYSYGYRYGHSYNAATVADGYSYSNSYNSASDGNAYRDAEGNADAAATPDACTAAESLIPE
jgi:hypothetical protein